MQGAYDWAVACVLDFFSGELDVGPKRTDLHTVHYDDMAAIFLSLGQIITHCNGLGQLVGLTIILTVVIIVMNYMIYMKEVNNISPTALATYSDMNKHYKYT